MTDRAAEPTNLVAAVDEEGPPDSFWRQAGRALLHRKTVLVALVVLVAIALAAIFAPLVTAHDPNAMRISERLQGPSAAHLFGTDEFGRDVFARVVYGSRISLAAGALTILLAGIAGIVLGVMAGFFQRLDGTISKVIDAMMAFPDILLAIALVAVLGPSLTNVVVSLGIVYTPRIARVVRASTLVIRELPFVEAARALGISRVRILQRHVLRNLVSPIIVQATFVFAYAILAEAGLSFLGVGVSPETPTWGTIINGGQQYARQAQWIMVFPGLAIILTVFSLQIIGDGLRDLLDPKLRRNL